METLWIYIIVLFVETPRKFITAYYYYCIIIIYYCIIYLFIIL